ncbi:hypothetical protein VTK73DRAFT_2065 [Phialemonium thermophilum]|uniref:Uncharacterized protein n=1 Tax=Phialemonium thermophilum TaxID=223376 RepID=A0ABR3VSN1_9PEZI
MHFLLIGAQQAKLRIKPAAPAAGRTHPAPSLLPTRASRKVIPLSIVPSTSIAPRRPTTASQPFGTMVPCSESHGAFRVGTCQQVKPATSLALSVCHHVD